MSQLTILHFSDTHLGFNDLDKLNRYGVNQREADFYKAFSDVIDAIIELKPNYVIHTGDLFHRASPSNRAITFALTQLKRLHEKNIPLVIIAGNHSTPRTSTSSPILEALSTLDNIYPVFAQRYEPIEFEDIIFHALPHINDERIIEVELEKLESHINPNKRNIMMMHASVGASYLMHEFGEWVYPKSKEYLFEKMDYVALGHWHGFGSVGKHPNVYYSGSTERTSSGDKRADKGYALITLADTLKVEHKSIALRPSLSYTIDANNFHEELAKIDLSQIQDVMVEVVLSNLTTSLSIDITNQEILDTLQWAFYVKVKREFVTAKESSSVEGIESISLEEYFVEHIKESVDDVSEQTRLTTKAKELFALYEESGDE